jgi:ABC-type Zn2+ transport system substrate-binding protein/surface adhesin
MSSHHRHDHDGHGHGHGHDEHDHSHDLEPALQSNLYKQIDFEGITTLNEAEPKSGAAVVKKTWAQRLDDGPELESDTDEQLLMHVP